MLDGLTREMKLAAMEYRAENHTLADTYDWLYVNYPHAERYTLNTFKAWSRSPEGKNDYKAASKRIKEEAGKGFGVSENRILAVMEVTMKILGKLRSLEADDKSYIGLNRELRENLKYIAEEAGDRMSDPVRDAYSSFVSTLNQDEKWKSIAEKVGLIQATPSN